MSSKNKGKRLIILLIALALLAAVFFIVYPKLHKLPEPAETIPVFSFEQADVDHITWRYDGEVNTFRRENDEYVWTEATAEDNIDWTNGKYMVSALRFLSAKKDIDLQSGADLSQYGIDRSADPDVLVVLKDGSEHKIWFGDETGIDSSYIYAWTGADKLYLITSYTAPKFQYKIDDLRVKDEEEGDTEAGA